VPIYEGYAFTRVILSPDLAGRDWNEHAMEILTKCDYITFVRCGAILGTVTVISESMLVCFTSVFIRFTS